MTQMEEHFDGSNDVGGGVAAVGVGAVPDSEFDASILQVKKVEVEFVNAVTAAMDFVP